MFGSVRLLLAIALFSLVGYGAMPQTVSAQEVSIDPVIEEPLRPLFQDDEVDIPTVGVGCGQLSLGPLLFGLPTLLLMRISGPTISLCTRMTCKNSQ